MIASIRPHLSGWKYNSFAWRTVLEKHHLEQKSQTLACRKSPDVPSPVARATFRWLGLPRPVLLGPVDKLTPELVP